jgi:uncharacterized protein
MSLPSRSTFKSSRYNFVVPVQSGLLLYNSASGAVLSLYGPDANCLAAQVSGVPRPVPIEELDSCLLDELLEGGFVVEDETDEVATIRERFHNAVAGTPIVLTITTTMDCNLGCYYCYEERSRDRLDVADTQQVVSLAQRLLVDSGKDSLHVDWYGGSRY